MRKKYFDVPNAIGVLGRTFVEPITPGLSQRGRLLGAVAQWQLRLCFFQCLQLRQTQGHCDIIQNVPKANSEHVYNTYCFDR